MKLEENLQNIKFFLNLYKMKEFMYEYMNINQITVSLLAYLFIISFLFG